MFFCGGDVDRLLFEALTDQTGAEAVRPQAAGALTAVPCNPALLALARARHVVLLQGPVGPFFDRLSRWLLARGANVSRVAFQPGDECDSRCVQPLRYKGDLAHWPTWFDALVASLGADTVVLFGQSRRHHALALERARALGLNAVVLEEGYIRPGFITMELDGVNASSITLDRFIWDEPSARTDESALRRPASPAAPFWRMATAACRHYWHLHWRPPFSPEYRHHRPTNVWQHARYWLWSWARKAVRALPDALHARALRDRPYFFVPLQHEGDSQITHHSPYPQNIAFIEHVIRSFAAHAPADALLVFKTHPHARGGPRYEREAKRMARELRLEHRVRHLVEGHTPGLVERARGVIVVNSTVGLQALHRGKPLAVLGQAIYKRPGLHHEGSLDSFWTGGRAADPETARRFLRQLIALTQLPCNVYGAASEPLAWPVPDTPGTSAEPARLSATRQGPHGTAVRRTASRPARDDAPIEPLAWSLRAWSSARTPQTDSSQ